MKAKEATSSVDKYHAMNAYRIKNDGLPDGAFFQLAEEVHGWTADDWAWFSDEYEKRQAKRKAGR